MAAKGYPGSYQKGKVIKGLAAASRMKDVVVFHAGTASKNGKVVTSGGRVLGVTALGDNIEKAIDRAYNAVSKIGWTGAYFRKDIGQKALNRTPLTPLVGIVMGSDSDWKIMEGAADALKHLNNHISPQAKLTAGAVTCPTLTGHFWVRGRRRRAGHRTRRMSRLRRVWLLS